MSLAQTQKLRKCDQNHANISKCCRLRLNVKRLIEILFVASTILLPVYAVAHVPYHYDFDNKQCCLVIGHALGGIDGNAYTNSIEALQANIERGISIFEADFSATSDGQWVLTHDWKSWQRRTKYSGTLPPSYAEFNKTPLQIKQHTYHAATIADLEQMLAQNPKMRIVTDTQYDFKSLVMALLKTKLAEAIIWQAYNLDDVNFLLSQKQNNIILTLYKMKIENAAKLFQTLNAKYADKILGVTMSLDFYTKNAKEVLILKTPVYLHGFQSQINSLDLHAELQDKVAGFYLD